MIPEPMVRLAQTVHLSCTDTNPISKENETRFDMTHVTLEFHRVHPNWFLSLCYVRRKTCNYSAPTLTSFPNGPNKIPHDPRHLGVPLVASKNDFRAYGMFGANCAPILRQD
jgi:hypothetical protein